MERNPLTQKVNFFVASAFIASFGLLFTFKILDALHTVNPIRDAVVATQEALEQN